MALIDTTSRTEAAWPRRRVALVVVRWGDGILGGAEAYARMVVDILKPHHDVSVLTSCARDTSTWSQHYAPGTDSDRGVAVVRFAHGQRNEGGRARVPLRHKLRFVLRGAIDALGWARAARPRQDDRLDGHEYLRRQGPWSPALTEHLRTAAGRYDCAVFLTALYSPTAHGLPVCGVPSLLVPTLHDEKPMVLPWFHTVFRAPSVVLWLADGERRLARKFYGPDVGAGPRSRVVGAGVVATGVSAADVAAVAGRAGVSGRWIVYAGRIEKGKGCADLVAAWLALSERARGDATLVLVGDGGMRTPEHPSILRTGFLDAAERDAWVAGATAAVVPSPNESLSLSLLEAMAQGIPVVANGRCEVLADHVANSGAGCSYRTRRGLRRALAQALTRDQTERQRLGAAGRRYIAERYDPAVVERGWLEAVEAAASSEG